MVTTRSQDRVDTSSPVAVNKRRRFNSEEPDDSIVVEVPAREAEDIRAQASAAETESDDDGAPEVISSKDAAQQARALPNRSVGPTGIKRRRIMKVVANDGDLPVTEPGLDASKTQELKSEDSGAADRATASSYELPEPNEDTLNMHLETGVGESTPADVTVLQTGGSKADALDTPADVYDSSQDAPAENHQKFAPKEEAQSLAVDADEGKAPAPEPMLEVRAAPVITDTEAATDTDLQPNLTPEAPPNAMEHLQGSTATQETLPSAEPAIVTTPRREDRVPGTPKSTTSGIITPVWQTRTHETPSGSTESPADTKTRNLGTARPRPHQKLPLHHQQLLTSKSKPTSLQQYQDRLLNRHRRTATWGPPGFRNTKFVGA